MFILKEHQMNGTVLMDEWLVGYDFLTFQNAVAALKKKLDAIITATILKDDGLEFIYRIDNNNTFPIYGNLKNEPLLIINKGENCEI